MYYGKRYKMLGHLAENMFKEIRLLLTETRV
jgi:hypothetical protein